MPTRHTRITAWVLFPILLWTFGGGPAYAVIAANEQARTAQREAARNALPRNFDDVLTELTTELDEVAAGDSDALDKTIALREEIRERDKKLRKEFADVEAMMIGNGMPDEILQRHKDFVATYEQRLAEFEAGLGKVERGAARPDGFFARAWFNAKVWVSGDPVREDAASETSSRLKQFKPQRVQKSFKPQDLPFRSLTPQQNLKPKETAEEWRKALDPEAQTSAVGKALGAVGEALIAPANAQSNDLPGPEDLAETIEVQFTPEIVALAAQLNNNPVEIYNWVRNNIEFVPVWGSIQGGDYCRQTRICNAFDTSSLLISLLRASGIPAQYEFGTIEVDEESAMNWLGGFDALEAAGRFAAAGGTPTTLYSKLDGSQALRVEHVWVRAFVDYIPSQGAVNRDPDSWIQLDPSYKQMNYSDPVDPESLYTLDIQQLLSDIESNSVFDSDGAMTSFDLTTVRSASANLASQVEASLTNMGQIESVRAFLGFPETAGEALPILPMAVNYQRVVEGVYVSELPAALRHQLTVSLESDDPFGVLTLQYSASLPELAGNRITLDFEPATQADRQAIVNLVSNFPGDETEVPDVVPATFLNFVPQLKVDGTVVETGPALRIGTTQKFSLTFNAPGARPSRIENELNAGEFFAIGLDIARISDEQMARHAQNLAALEQRVSDFADDPANSPPLDDDVRAEFFSAIIDAWFATVDFVKDTSYRNAQAAWARYPSAGLLSSDMAPEPLFGVPWRVRSTGMVMDIDRNLSVSESRIGDAESLRNVTYLQGVAGSALESNLPMSFFKADPDYSEPGFAYSAVDVIVESMEQGIPILSLDSSNYDSLRSRLVLDEGSQSDVSAAIAAGRVVVVPEQPLDIGDRAIAGFMVLDPETGAGDYIIGQSFSGGLVESLIKATASVWGAFLGVAADCADTVGCNTRGASKFKFSYKTFARHFGIAAGVLSAANDTYWIMDNTVATDEQKGQAIVVIWLFTAISIALTFGSVAGGPFAVMLAGLVTGWMLDAIKGSILANICTCFAALFDAVRRRFLMVARRNVPVIPIHGVPA